jgi:hypothetical protein
MKSKRELLEEMEDLWNQAFGKREWSDEAAAVIIAAAVLGNILSGIEASLDDIHNNM